LSEAQLAGIGYWLSGIGFVVLCSSFYIEIQGVILKSNQFLKTIAQCQIPNTPQLSFTQLRFQVKFKEMRDAFSAEKRIINPATKFVIPAAAERRAGIQIRCCNYWIPAFAGMTRWLISVGLINCQVNRCV